VGACDVWRSSLADAREFRKIALDELAPDGDDGQPTFGLSPVERELRRRLG
jgi:hypothetical protein